MGHSNVNDGQRLRATFRVLLLATLALSGTWGPSVGPAAAIAEGEVLTNVSDIADGLTTKAFLFRNLDGSLRVIDQSRTVANNASVVWLELREDDASAFRVQAVKTFIDTTKGWALPKFEVAGKDLAWTRAVPRNTTLNYDLVISTDFLAGNDTLNVRISEEVVAWNLTGLLGGQSVFGLGNVASVALNRSEGLWWTLDAAPTPRYGDATGRLAFTLTFEPGYGRSNAGAPVRFNKTWLAQTFNVTTPYVEWGHGSEAWKPLPVTDAGTYWVVTPENFSTIGVHEAANGLVDHYVSSRSDEATRRMNPGDFLGNTTTYSAFAEGTVCAPIICRYITSSTQASGYAAQVRQRVTVTTSGYLYTVKPSLWASTDSWSDFAYVEVYADNGGSMGALLDSAAVPAIDQGNTSFSIFPAYFYNATFLQAGTSYWFVVRDAMPDEAASGAGWNLHVGMTGVAGNYNGYCEGLRADGTWSSSGSGGANTPGYCMLDVKVRDSTTAIAGDLRTPPGAKDLEKEWRVFDASGVGATFSAGGTGFGFTSPSTFLLWRADVSMEGQSACKAAGPNAYFDLYQVTGQDAGAAGSVFLQRSRPTAIITGGGTASTPIVFDPPVSLSAGGNYAIIWGVQGSGAATCTINYKSASDPSIWKIENGAVSAGHQPNVLLWEGQYVTAQARQTANLLPANTNQVFGARITASGDTSAASVKVTNGVGSTVTGLVHGGSLTSFANPASGTTADFVLTVTGGTSTPRAVNYVDLLYTRETRYTNAITRSVGSNSETDTMSATATEAWSTPVHRLAVTNRAQAISTVTLSGGGITANQVSPCPLPISNLAANQWCFDTANYDIYIRAPSIASGASLSASVQATWGGTFNITVPGFVRSGDYIMTMGVLKDANGDAISNQFATMEVLNLDGTALPNGTGKGPTYFVQAGNFLGIQTTSYIPPGGYVVQVAFTDAGSGLTIKKTYPITVGRGIVSAGGGGDSSNPVYADGMLYYKFFDNRTGNVLDQDFYKVYVSTDTTLDDSDRVVGGTLPVYVGTRVYVAVKDYFGHQVFPPVGGGGYHCTGPDNGPCPFAGQTSTYAYFDVQREKTFFDIGVTLYQLKFKNTQTEPAYAQVTANGKTLQTYVLPGEIVTMHVPYDTYTVSTDIYDATNPSRLMDYAYYTDAAQTASISPLARPHFVDPTTLAQRGWNSTTCGGPCTTAPLDTPGGVEKAGDRCLNEDTASITDYCYQSAAGGNTEDLVHLGTLDLARVARINRIALSLLDADARYYYGFAVEVSADPDHDGWTSVYDSRLNSCAGGRTAGQVVRTGATRTLANYCGTANIDFAGQQMLEFPALDARYVRIFGSQNTVNTGFHLKDISATASATATVVADRDTFLWIRGYDLYSIVFAINNVGSQVYDQQVNIGVHIQNSDSTILQQTVNVAAMFNNTNTFIGNQLVSMFAGINNTNSNILNQATLLHANINNFQSNITNQINALSLNVTNLDGRIGAQFNLVVAEIQNHGIRPPDEVELRGYWSFDHLNGTSIATDESRYKNNGTLTNFGASTSTAWGAGSIGNALRFDGADDLVLLPDASVLDATTALSVEYWVSPRRVSGGGNQVLVYNGLSGTDASYKTFLSGSSAQFNFNVIHSDNSASALATSGLTLTANRWYHVVNTWQPGLMRIYVDGAKVAEGGAGTLALKSTSGIAAHIGGLPSLSLGCECSMDEVRIYGRVLAPDEVTAHYYGLNPALFQQFNLVSVSVANTNTSIGAQVNLVSQKVTNTESNLTAQINSVQVHINNMESNITTQLTFVNATVTNTNSTMVSQTNYIQAQIVNQNVNLTTQFNAQTTTIRNAETNITNQTNLLSIQIENMNASMVGQINSVRVDISNSNATIHSQLNNLVAQVTNSNLSAINQVNLVWSSVNNTNSSIHTAITGVSARIDVFHSNVNNSFAILQANISYGDTVILNNITEMNATLFGKMLEILDDAAARGGDVFNETARMMANLTAQNENASVRLADVLDELSLQNQNLAGNVTASTNAVLARLDSLNATALSNLTARLDSVLAIMSSPHTIYLPFLNYTGTDDVDPPLTRVFASPDLGNRSTARVTFSSGDGTAVLRVDVFYRREGDSWSRLATETHASGVVYLTEAVEGQTYWFKAIGTDLLGHVEEDPGDNLSRPNLVKYVHATASLPFEPLARDVNQPWKFVPGPSFAWLVLAAAVAVLLARHPRRPRNRAHGPRRDRAIDEPRMLVNGARNP